jgi:hypothetical protein
MNDSAILSVRLNFQKKRQNGIEERRPVQIVPGVGGKPSCGEIVAPAATASHSSETYCSGVVNPALVCDEPQERSHVAKSWAGRSTGNFSTMR